MVDAQSLDQPIRHEIGHEPMGVAEDPFVFLAHPDQFGDGEEASVCESLP